MENRNNVKAHFSLFLACVIFGLMAPLGSHAMHNGISGLNMVTFRVSGAALCFWIASFFTKHESVSRRDMLMFFFAGMLSIVFNQCCYIIGLSITSPVNASIVTTTMPIITMILAALFLKEPITSKKVLGIVCGVSGAAIIISSSASAASSRDGKLLGDILCLISQTSFAIYLTIFKSLIQRYSVFTCMKWMFLYSTLVVLPFSFGELTAIPFASISLQTWGETAFVVFLATFVAYIFLTYGQQNLRPTVVSVYNYLQPIVACLVSVVIGVGTFGLSKGLAAALVFTGVWLVTKSKSRADLDKEKSLQNR